MSSETVYNTAMPDLFNVPKAMGQPKPGQLVGTPLELLAEVAGRVCYDSLGTGRSSADWHKHVKEVGHLSVYEHCTFVLEFNTWKPQWSELCWNKPALWLHRPRGKVRMVLNLRHVLEWDTACPLYTLIAQEAHNLAPQVVPLVLTSDTTCRLVKPANVNEVWVSAWISGSRGWSHEQVRHGDWSAISQRSTRYVDESSSPILDHPLLREYFDEHDFEFEEHIDGAKGGCQSAYDLIVSKLETWLVDEKKETLDFARKQARGAARLMLPMGLETQMIFSASLAQWNHIFRMRCNRFADGEIAVIMKDVQSNIKGDPQYAEDDDPAGS